MKSYFYFLSICIIFIACKNQKKNPAEDRPIIKDSIEQVVKEPMLPLCERPEKEQVVMALIDELGEEYENISENDRQFSYEVFDLNGDGQKEYLVGLVSPYFCGSGGCTAYIFHSDLRVHSRFSVIEFPIKISSKFKTKGWSDIYANSDGKFHRLKCDGEKYPSNPSMEPVIEIDHTEDIMTLMDYAYETKCSF